MSRAVRPASLVNKQLDHGIERVVRGVHALTDFARDGDLIEVPPPQEPTRSRLDDLFGVTSLADYLDDAISPHFAHAVLLSPARFHDALARAIRHLRDQAQSDPRHARVLARAARQLSDQVALRDLLQTYRNALLQG